MFKALGNLIMEPAMPKFLFAGGRSMYAPMRILRLADQKAAAMDKLYFYLRQTDVMLPRYLPVLEELAAELLTEVTRDMINDKNDLASTNDNTEESDSDNDFSEESDDEDVEQEPTSKWTTNSLTHQVMRLWDKRRQLMCNDYSLVAYILSPHPTIMADAQLGKTAEHDDAVDRLIKKLILEDSLVGDARKDKYSELVAKFWTEHNQFWNRTGRFNRDHLWPVASTMEAHRWHQTFSLGITDVLGKLACLVTSKILGIGSAERNWKQVKRVKSGQAATTKIEKTTKKVTVHGEYLHRKSYALRQKESAAGKLWNEEDFRYCKMDDYCKEIADTIENDSNNGNVRIFRAWKEGWENKTIGPKGDPIFEARLVKKYGGLSWRDCDNGDVKVNSHPSLMIFEKIRGNNHYCVFGCNEGYDYSVDKHLQNSLWEAYETEPWFYDLIVEYYKKGDKVKCYEKGGECDSESGEDE